MYWHPFTVRWLRYWAPSVRKSIFIHYSLTYSPTMLAHFCGTSYNIPIFLWKYHKYTDTSFWAKLRSQQLKFCISFEESEEHVERTGWVNVWSKGQNQKQHNRNILQTYQSSLRHTSSHFCSTHTAALTVWNKTVVFLQRRLCIHILIGLY